MELKDFLVGAYYNDTTEVIEGDLLLLAVDMENGVECPLWMRHPDGYVNYYENADWAPVTSDYGWIFYHTPSGEWYWEAEHIKIPGDAEDIVRATVWEKILFNMHGNSSEQIRAAGDAAVCEVTL